MSNSKREPRIRHDLGRPRNSGVRRSLAKKPTGSVAPAKPTGSLPGGLRLTSSTSSGRTPATTDLRGRAAAAARKRREAHPIQSDEGMTMPDRMMLSELTQALREHTDTLREVHGLDAIEREDTTAPEPVSEPTEGDEEDEEDGGVEEGTVEEEQEDASGAASEPEAEAS